MQSKLPCNPLFKIEKNEGEKDVSGSVGAGEKDSLGLCVGNLSVTSV